MFKRKRAGMAAAIGLSLIAAACGSSGGGGDGNATGQTIDEGVNNGVKDALNGTTTVAGSGATTTSAVATEAYPTTMAEWNARWEKERKAILDRIEKNGWGTSADGKTATGPEGFTIDLSKCPAGWNNLEGLTDTEIKIGQTLPLSGAAAAYGQLAKGMNARIATINAAGGIKDVTGKSRKLTYIAKDDGYDPARTIPLVDELTDSDKVFAVYTLGTAPTMKTYDKLNQRCIPQPFAQTGHPAWGDPVNHPWTFGEQMAYNTEAVLWGAFLEKHADELKKVDGKITVAAIIANNDFGKAYDVGFKAWLAQSPIKNDVEYVTEVHEPTAPTITDPMTTLASKNPEVFIAMTFAAYCTQTIVEAAQDGIKDKAKYVFQPSVCKGNSYAGKEKVGGDGSAANGWWMVGGGQKTPESPAFDNDAWVKFSRDELTAAGIDWKTETSTFLGSRWGWSLEQLLMIASQMKGGLSRSNLIVAGRTFDMTPPHLLAGAKFNMNGNKDAYLTEASDFSTYDSTKQGYTQQGEIIELSGKSKNCAFDQSTGSCK